MSRPALRQLLASAAARQHRNRGGTRPTPRADLRAWAGRRLAGQRLVIASNREPYAHEHDGCGVRCVRGGGGLTVALEAVARAVGGVWVAHGSGGADRETVDERDRVACPPGDPAFTLRRLWLGENDHARYYSGFANSGLWPLCHIVHVRPRFRSDEWECYRSVNQRFARAILEEIGDGPALVFLQDYHLALVAQEIKRVRPDIRTALFWHIPWPNAEVFERLPWQRELLEGLLANDVLGFHIRFHALNFLETVARALEARVDVEHMAVHRDGMRTWVRDYPIGVDVDEIESLADSPRGRDGGDRWSERLGLGDERLGVGVDRLDYTKGIPERLEALERFYEQHPEWVSRFRFLQVAVPTRIELVEYQAVRERTRDVANRINARFGRPGAPRVHLLEESIDFADLVPLYARADLCAVTSLHDGMNLVAKEYVASSCDLEGQLVLSPFTGAARELEDAWIASPYDRDGLAEVFHGALVESAPSRRSRMSRLREAVRARTIFDWAMDVLGGALTLGARRAADGDDATDRPDGPAIRP